MALLLRGLRSSGTSNSVCQIKQGHPAGGIKGGTVHGETCPFGYNIVKDRVHVSDFHATILHLLGIDHERLSYKFQGLDARLTGVEESHVLREILV